MCVKIISTCGVVLTLIGTILAIVPLIKMKNKDIEDTTTAGYLDNMRESSLRKEVCCSRFGIAIIIVGSVLQLIGIWY